MVCDAQKHIDQVAKLKAAEAIKLLQNPKVTEGMVKVAEATPPKVLRAIVTTAHP
eukprot:SAG31_NODE_314_length_17854_cov_3.932075_9_plen_55_part_00